MSENKKSDKSAHADTVIRNHVIWSMGGGLIPIIAVDVLAVSLVQMDMIKQLCKTYGIEYKETEGKAIVTSLTTSTLARLGARGLVKMIPVVGPYIGGATSSIFAGASTYALGQVFKTHFSTGGTILDFEVGRLKKLYDEQFEKGKEIVKNWKKKDVVDDFEEENQQETEESTREPEPKAADSQSSALQRLKELGELKDAGIITEDEFNDLKKKILGNF